MFCWHMKYSKMKDLNKPIMKKTLYYICWIAIVLSFNSCNNKTPQERTDNNVKHFIADWGKKNHKGKVKIQWIKYDTIGNSYDYLFNGMMLNESILATTKTKKVYEDAAIKLMSESVLDSVSAKETIIVAKIFLEIEDTGCFYYLGLRDDRILSELREHGYEALVDVQSDGQKEMYNACRVINSNLMSLVDESSGDINKKDDENDYYLFWISLPGYDKTMRSMLK